MAQISDVRRIQAPPIASELPLDFLIIEAACEQSKEKVKPLAEDVNNRGGSSSMSASLAFVVCSTRLAALRIRLASFREGA